MSQFRIISSRILIFPLVFLATTQQSGSTSIHHARSRRAKYFPPSSGPVLRVELVGQKQAVTDDEETPVPKKKASGFWPPWPLNLLLSKTKEQKQEYRSAATLFFAYARQRAKKSFRQLQQVASDLSYHAPPGMIPFVTLAALPTRVAGKKAAPPLFTVPFVRNLALTSLGIAVMSWSHSEFNRKNRLVPLPLKPEYMDISRAILPPFLPESVPPPIDATVSETSSRLEDASHSERIEKPITAQVETPPDAGKSTESTLLDNPRLRRLWRKMNKIRLQADVSSTWMEWTRARAEQKREHKNASRQQIYDLLVALQAIKKKEAKKNKPSSPSRQPPTSNQSTQDLGYALVTGASRGIGRAIAVELARWEIPLILVARDLDQLTSLASDLESCYGVSCFVLQADLSKAGAALKIHEATKRAGLTVDVLVNNAGICTHGMPMVDTDHADTERMIQVNAMSVGLLSHLYGKDMKERGRGRILTVSSVAGVGPGAPGVSTYAATKAFEKSLAIGMGKELEKYGVGVTCLLPGAVVGSDFASASQIDDALCWKLPFYPKSAQFVAKKGVRALLSGDPEVTPGWQNRVFGKVLHVILPQRMMTMVVEVAFNPFHPTLPRINWGNVGSPRLKKEEEVKDNPPKQHQSSSELLPNPFFAKPKIPPRLLTLPEEEKEKEEAAPAPADSGAPAAEDEASGEESSIKDDQGITEKATENHASNDVRVDDAPSPPLTAPKVEPFARDFGTGGAKNPQRSVQGATDEIEEFCGSTSAGALPNRTFQRDI